MSDQVSKLVRENQRLVALLEKHKIEWQVATEITDIHPTSVVSNATGPQLSIEEKIALFQSLFRGRTDLHALHWASADGKRSGYSPACANEWQRGICEKPRIKCSECAHRQFMPMSSDVIFNHLSGNLTAGVYPLLEDNTCFFLAVDFDKSDWRVDVQAFATSCDVHNIPVSIEISRSGEGAHAWIFFTQAIEAREARQLGTLLISHTCAANHQLDLSSYDRIFPNQDTMPKGGFGNLIALPLQKKSRDNNCAVFVDRDLNPVKDQWAYLAAVGKLDRQTLDSTLLTASAGPNLLDVSFIDEEDLKEPWVRKTQTDLSTLSNLPKNLVLTLSDKLYIEKERLPQPLLNRLIRLAAFQNPEFYKAQAMRFPVWGKPRVIGCADDYPFHIALPRGCLEATLELMDSLSISVTINDERCRGEPLQTEFLGKLLNQQSKAVHSMLQTDTGILSAPTAFGKTVVAAAIIAQRKTNTLILVHRAELLEQWYERLQTFLDLPPDCIGRIGGGKKKTTSQIDIALVQSLSRKGVVNELVEQYGQVIVDECHHVGAQSFEAILKRTKARFVLGLTATPIRRDGQQPIIFMQCGPIRHRAQRDNESTLAMQVNPIFREEPITVAENDRIQDVFKALTNDTTRTQQIAEIARHCYNKGKNVLVLTERTDHIEALQAVLPDTIIPYVLHGKVNKKVRKQTLTDLQAIHPAIPRILLATGKLIGEGFDHAALDVLILAHPVSWKGTLQQYVGRLHRSHMGKDSVTVVDIVDLGHPALVRMWEKRQKGYRAMGYTIKDESNDEPDLLATFC